MGATWLRLATTQPRFVPRMGNETETKAASPSSWMTIRADSSCHMASLHAKGYEVDEAGSGEQALDLTRTEKYDLIILDINCPAKRAWRLAGKSTRCPPPPLSCLLFADAGEDRIEALDGGVCDYVTKPFAMGEQWARIRAVLRRTPSIAISGITLLKLDDVEVNFESRRVIVAGKPVRLTSKEFEYLLFFVGDRNRHWYFFNP